MIKKESWKDAVLKSIPSFISLKRRNVTIWPVNDNILIVLSPPHQRRQIFPCINVFETLSELTQDEFDEKVVTNQAKRVAIFMSSPFHFSTRND